MGFTNSLDKFYSLRIDGVKTGQGQSTNNYLQLYTILSSFEMKMRNFFF